MQAIYSTRTLLRVLKASILLAALVFVLQVQPVSAVTSVPTRMNFQGKLMDSSGNVMPDGVYNMRMKIYSDETAGTLLWSAERLVSAGEGVTV
ncbi:TPA: hypothetical protein DIV49_00085, partial [Candidatus Saccharibacteria bacterium]|nr:hypothetical protein [Candidatus Saccharibacteria bacterium]